MADYVLDRIFAERLRRNAGFSVATATRTTAGSTLLITASATQRIYIYSALIFIDVTAGATHFVEFNFSGLGSRYRQIGRSGNTIRNFIDINRAPLISTPGETLNLTTSASFTGTAHITALYKLRAI